MKIFNYKFINNIFVLILFVGVGCANKKKINNFDNKKKINWNYNIGIEGIECKLCAYKTVKRLEKIEHISDVKMICTTNFKECYANLNWSDVNNNIDINAIGKAIGNEGFEIKYISGNFIGKFDEKLDKFVLNYLDQTNKNLEIKFMNAQQNNFVLPINQVTIVNAKLIFQKQLNEIWMTLNIE